MVRPKTINEIKYNVFKITCLLYECESHQYSANQIFNKFCQESFLDTVSHLNFSLLISIPGKHLASVLAKSFLANGEIILSFLPRMD